MKKPWIFLLALVFAGAANAQQYKWIDKDGKTRYGDTPPAGVKATPLGAPASGSAPAAAASAGADSKDAKKGPLTPAEQEQAYRKREEAAAKAREKSDEERQTKAANAENCARAKDYLRTLESGQRMTRTDAAGERYFLDDSQIAQEIPKARQTMQQNCN